MHFVLETGVPWINGVEKEDDYASWTIIPKQGSIDNGSPLIGSFQFSIHTKEHADVMRIENLQVTGRTGDTILVRDTTDVSLQEELRGKSKHVENGDIWIYFGPDLELSFQTFDFECEVYFLDAQGMSLSGKLKLSGEISHYTQNVGH